MLAMPALFGWVLELAVAAAFFPCAAFFPRVVVFGSALVDAIRQVLRKKLEIGVDNKVNFVEHLQDDPKRFERLENSISHLPSQYSVAQRKEASRLARIALDACPDDQFTVPWTDDDENPCETCIDEWAVSLAPDYWIHITVLEVYLGLLTMELSGASNAARWCRLTI